MTLNIAKTGMSPVAAVPIRDEADVVAARQQARQLAALVGFSNQDQVRIATAVSELARNAFQYGRGGRVEFGLALTARPQALWVTVSDNGPGIADLKAVMSGRQHSGTGMGVGLTGSRRLIDDFEIETQAGEGTTIQFSKKLPADAPRLASSDLERLAARLIQDRLPAAMEAQLQNRDLFETLESLRLRELELEKRNAEMRRINAELEETNRGVVALYAELDEKAAALRSADELKGRFLRHVSHEFRTPLNAILALTQLLLRKTDGGLTPEQELQVGYIRKATQDLTEMVNDLLDLAKVESGTTELHYGPIHLGQLFGALRGIMRPLVLHDNVALIFEEPKEDVFFQSDEAKIAQILRNLISNAVKFTEHGEVRVSFEISEGRLRVSVADTGIGIAPEDQDRIFREFAQVKNAIQSKVKGTGLGLPLSRKLAGLLGGDLTVVSVPGEGSRFTMDIPVSPVVQPLEAICDPDAGCILIIDDDESARYVARQRFRGTRYRLIEAPGGIEGAERARFEQPKLILLDLTMPDRNGFDVLADLKADPNTRDIPVFIHTSQKLREFDFENLGHRHAAILPKGESWPQESLEYMRQLLGEPDL
ncbi:MAG TPA: ATP-binding protein, partial [Candidatus Acidoferrum sp.]|nr:ATP-binding protein [Candidatus Acidoferrum sp.]